MEADLLHSKPLCRRYSIVGVFANNPMLLIASAIAELELLLARLKTRDQGIFSAALSFDSKVSYPPGFVDCPGRDLGWWFWTPSTESCVVLTGCSRPQSAVALEHVVWDGVTTLRDRGVFTWDEADAVKALHPPQERIEATISPGQAKSVLSKMSMPSHHGLFFHHTRWSEYLPGLSQLHVAGRETFEGRDCCVLVADMDMSGDVGYSYPWRFVIDDRETLLVLKCESFSECNAAASTNLTSGSVLKLGGKEWQRQSFIHVYDPQLLPVGIWIGSRSISGLDELPGVSTETILDVAVSSLNEPLPTVALNRRIAEGTIVDDEVSGSRYFEGHKDDPVYAYNREHLELLRQVSPETAERWIDVTELREPLLEVGQAAVGAYFYAWLNGLECALETVRLSEELASPGRRDESVSLSKLEKALGAVGIASRRYIATDTVTLAHGWCLGLVADRLGSLNGRVAIFKAISPDELFIYYPGHSAQRAEQYEVLPLLIAGYCAAGVDGAFPPGESPAEGRPAGTARAPFIAIAIAILAGVWCFIVRRRSHGVQAEGSASG